MSTTTIIDNNIPFSDQQKHNKLTIGTLNLL